MKKVVAMLLCMTVCGAALFAQETVFGISAGAGGFVGGDFGGGVEGSASLAGQSFSMKYEIPYFGGGGFLFLDATYAELTLAFYSGSGTVTTTTESPGGSQSQNSDMSAMSFNISLLGKYPFAVNQEFSVFPLLGVEYDICLSAKDEAGEYEGVDGNGTPGDFSALWFKLGGGLDFSFTEKICLRFEALYGLRLASKAENDMKDFFDKEFKSLEDYGADVETKILLGHGWTAKLAVGYKF
jgi:opacity protein-like surface antigen